MKGEPNTRMSDEFDWDVSRAEKSQELFEKFDIQKAKQIIRDKSRPIESLDLEKYRAWAEDYLEGVRLKDDMDWSKVDTSMPIIFGREKSGKFPIDGRHRLAKALKEGQKSIPLVYLTEDETESVRSGIRI